MLNLVADVLVEVHFFGIHAVLGEVFDFDGFEFAHAGVECELDPMHIFDFHSFEELSAEVEACDGGGDATFDLGVEGLIVFGIVLLDVAQFTEFFGQGRAAHAFDDGHELLV